jgi:hypothetical protein
VWNEPCKILVDNSLSAANKNYKEIIEMLKIYWTLWALIALIALLLFVTGNFTMLTLIAVGFVVFGMIFMGMISVLPSMVGHNAPRAEPKPVKVETVKEEKGLFPSKNLATR